MTTELSVFKIQGLEDPSQKYVSLIPFKLGENQSSLGPNLNIGDELNKYNQQQQQEKPRYRKYNNELLENNAIETDYNDVYSNTSPVVEDGLGKPAASKKQINLIKQKEAAMSTIKKLPYFLAKKFHRFLKILRKLKSKIKIYLKQKNKIKYIHLTKHIKISFIHFVHILFSSIDKLRKSLNDPVLTNILQFCRKLPSVALASLGSGIKKLLQA